MSRRIHLPALIAIALFPAWTCAGVSYTSLQVLGDSLSDVGNVYLASGGATPDPLVYWHGRESNGPVWVEDLANLLGLPPQSPGGVAGTNGTNYAFYGAQATGLPTLQPPPMNAQVTISLAKHTPSASDLYVLWGGTNDLSGGQFNATIPANAIASQVSTLAAAGARQFLVGDLPPLGKTPAVRGTILESFADQWAATFNSTLHTDLVSVQKSYPDAQIHILPTFDLFTGILDGTIANPFKNVTDPAMNFPNDNPDDFLFWDSGHPTRAAHQFLANEAYNILVPEPAAVFLLIVSALALRRPRAA